MNANLSNQPNRYSDLQRQVDEVKTVKFFYFNINL